MLHSLITDHERGIPGIFRQLLVEGSWVAGESLPDKNPSAPRMIDGLNLAVSAE